MDMSIIQSQTFMEKTGQLLSQNKPQQGDQDMEVLGSHMTLKGFTLAIMTACSPAYCSTTCHISK